VGETGETIEDSDFVDDPNFDDNESVNDEVDDEDSRDDDGNRTIIKIRGNLVNILCEIDPIYSEYVVQEGHQSVLYVHVQKAIYGLPVSAMLFSRKLRDDLLEQEFAINPYDPCVANKVVNGKQLTVCCHVDDLKASHVQPQVVDNFISWVKQKYGTIDEVKVIRGKIHSYLGMTLDYSTPGEVSVDMTQLRCRDARSIPY
jgi:hypothetical protein